MTKCCLSWQNATRCTVFVTEMLNEETGLDGSLLVHIWGALYFQVSTEAWVGVAAGHLHVLCRATPRVADVTEGEARGCACWLGEKVKVFADKICRWLFSSLVLWISIFCQLKPAMPSCSKAVIKELVLLQCLEDVVRTTLLVQPTTIMVVCSLSIVFISR